MVNAMSKKKRKEQERQAKELAELEAKRGLSTKELEADLAREKAKNEKRAAELADSSPPPADNGLSEEQQNALTFAGLMMAKVKGRRQESRNHTRKALAAVEEIEAKAKEARKHLEKAQKEQTAADMAFDLVNGEIASLKEGSSPSLVKDNNVTQLPIRQQGEAAAEAVDELIEQHTDEAPTAANNEESPAEEEPAALQQTG